MSDPTLDIRLRDDAREMWWRVQTGQPLTAFERKNIAMAIGDLEVCLKADEDAKRDMESIARKVA